MHILEEALSDFLHIHDVRQYTRDELYSMLSETFADRTDTISLEAIENGYSGYLLTGRTKIEFVIETFSVNSDDD